MVVFEGFVQTVTREFALFVEILGTEGLLYAKHTFRNCLLQQLWFLFQFCFQMFLSDYLFFIHAAYIVIHSSNERYRRPRENSSRVTPPAPLTMPTCRTTMKLRKNDANDRMTIFRGIIFSWHLHIFIQKNFHDVTIRCPLILAFQ